MNDQQCQVALVEDASYAPLLCREILQAENSIDVAMYLCTLDILSEAHPRSRVVIRALALAANRGVNVRMLFGIPGRTRLAHLNRVAAAFMQSKGVETRTAQNQLLHTKLVIIDNKFTVLGSHNLTDRAMTENCELSVAMWDTTSATALSSQFTELWLQAA